MRGRCREPRTGATSSAPQRSRGGRCDPRSRRPWWSTWATPARSLTGCARSALHAGPGHGNDGWGHAAEKLLKKKCRKGYQKELDIWEI